MSLHRGVSLIPCALLSLAACADPTTEPTRQTTQRVFDGEASGPENDAIVLIFAGPEVKKCTATVVGPRMLLTARHCISPYVEGVFTCTTDGAISDTATRNPGNAGAVGAAYDPETVYARVGRYPFDDEISAYGEKVYTVSTDTICRNDIALVRMDRDLAPPPRPIRLTTPTVPGEFITAIGYGKSFAADQGRYERSGVEVLAVGKSTLYPQGGSAYDRTIRVGPSVCPGDSGGPALAENGTVLGVSSIIEVPTGGDCRTDGVRNYFAQAAPYRTFIEESFADSGMDVIYETPPDDPGAGGAPGAAGADPTGSSGGSGGSGTGGSSGGSSSGGSGGSGGTESETSTGGSSSDSGGNGSADGDTDGVRVISGRKKDDEGCSCSVIGDATPRGHWTPWLFGLLLLRRRFTKLVRQH